MTSSGGTPHHDGAIGGDYPSPAHWLANGLRRQPWAVVTALVFSWTGVSYALWGAVVGAVLGAISGFGQDIVWFGFTSRIGATRATTVATVLGGLAFGTLVGFLGVATAVVRHPVPLIGSLVSGAVVSLIVILVIAAAEPMTLEKRRFRQMTTPERLIVEPLLDQLADRMGLTGVPTILVNESQLADAWTHMRTVVLTKGAIKLWTPPELMAVLAHELHHWRSGDSVGQRLVWAASFPMAVAYTAGSFIATGKPVPKGQAPQAPASTQTHRLLGWFLLWPAWVFVKGVIAPLVSATQRRYEFEADAAAAELGLGPYLATALERIAAFHQARTGWEAAMTEHHPSIDVRIDRLRYPQDAPAVVHGTAYESWWQRLWRLVERVIYRPE